MGLKEFEEELILLIVKHYDPEFEPHATRQDKSNRPHMMDALRQYASYDRNWDRIRTLVAEKGG